VHAGLPTSIPSPSQSVVHLGVVPLRGYALMIILGVLLALTVGERRLRRRGYPAGTVADIALWAVPFGIVGARIYHVVTDNQLYFRPGRDWVTAFAVWDGGLGIWGAVALGAVGAWIGCRRLHVPLGQLADALAPALLLGQGLGRWGNWFNQELYGRPSSLPWAVHIDLAHRLPQYAGVATYQPTFLYEFLWDVLGAGFVLLAEQRQWFGRLSRGRAFALYLAVYAVGRGWIEALRIDPAPHFLGIRLDDYTAVVVLVLAVLFLVRVRPQPGDEVVPAAALEIDQPRALPAPRRGQVPVGGNSLVDLMRGTPGGARQLAVADRSDPAPAADADPLEALRRPRDLR
jgi:prolipoprotein diacylglyceryl transferase